MEIFDILAYFLHIWKLKAVFVHFFTTSIGVLQEAIALIEPLVSAKENFVRQGAVIALSFIHIQQTEATCPKVSMYYLSLRVVDVFIKFSGHFTSNRFTKMLRSR